MRLKVSENCLVIPPSSLEGLDEVEVSRTVIKSSVL